jgi:tetratricopeptide (TPR) repeat protein
LLTKLAPRKQHALPALIYIADTSAELGETDRAGQLYQTILQQADGDPAFKQANAAALTRIQARLVGLLRQKGQYAEGLAQVDKLIAAHPNALEPKMEKGRLLQAWAETEPTHFNEAVAHWTMLRTRLSKATKKPPEYYEVVYNAANCLFAESMKARNPQKALQAEQLLNATLVLSPHLSGPEMVARYKELLRKARQLQGRPTTTAKQS